MDGIGHLVSIISFLDAHARLNLPPSLINWKIRENPRAEIGEWFCRKSTNSLAVRGSVRFTLRNENPHLKNDKNNRNDIGKVVSQTVLDVPVCIDSPI
jgi:hypothetical protein